MTSSIRIGKDSIGKTHPCYVIAEAGVNHNGDPLLAHKLVDIAADAGANAFKMQTFDPVALVTGKADMASYQAANTGIRQSQREMLASLTLSHDDHLALQQHCRQKGLTFLSTPFDPQSARFLALDLNVPAFKVSSGDLTNLPLLGDLARYGKPVLISTGMADLQETGTAVSCLEKNGACDIGILHCTSQYPALPDTLNLRAIQTLQDHFSWPVGYSDHSLGDQAAITSLALGATIIEKHFTLDKNLPGPDHACSLEPEDLALYIQSIRTTEIMLGHGRKEPHPSEAETARLVRKSVTLTRDLAAGHILGPGDLCIKRPGHGIPPARIKALSGKSLMKALPADTTLEYAHLDDESSNTP